MTGAIARHFTVFYFKAVVVRHFRSCWDVDPCKKTNVVFTAGFDDFRVHSKSLYAAGIFPEDTNLVAPYHAATPAESHMWPTSLKMVPPTDGRDACTPPPWIKGA